MSENTQSEPTESRFQNLDLGERLKEAEEASDFDEHHPVAAAKRQDDEQKKKTAELEYKAHHDELTGLLNKKAWRDRAEQAIAGSDDVAVVFIDLTNFKAINDNSPGRHITGDNVLKQVAEAITANLREDDRELASREQLIQPQEGEAGRYGGDEFTLLLDLTSRGENQDISLSKEDRMNVVVDRLRAGFGKLLSANEDLVNNHGFDIAIGGAVKQPGMSADQLIIEADHAMEKDKAAQHTQHGSYR
jgi:diguanylate cyclase (GGDEF)-like protein